MPRFFARRSILGAISLFALMPFANAGAAAPNSSSGALFSAQTLSLPGNVFAHRNDLGDAASRRVIVAGMQWNTPEAAQVKVLADQYLDVFERFIEHRNAFLVDLMDQNWRVMSPHAVWIQARAARLWEEAETLNRKIQEILGTTIPNREQLHFNPMQELLLRRLQAGKFPIRRRTFEAMLVKSPVVFMMEIDWLETHPQVFDLRDYTFSPYDVFTHKKPLLKLHSETIRRMWKAVMPFHLRLLFRSPRYRWEFVRRNRGILEHKMYVSGFQAHSAWNTNRMNKFAGLQNSLPTAIVPSKQILTGA